MSSVPQPVLPQVADGEKHAQQTRWINFWAGESDADAIRAIAKRYGMSPRFDCLALLDASQSSKIVTCGSSVSAIQC
jgi:hypothetical protein